MVDMKLILASASKGREYLVKLLKIPYQIMPSSIDEENIVGKNLVETVKLRARLKGEYVARKIIQLSNSQINKLSNKSVFILSADTEVILGDKLLGKPKDYQDAVRMLKMLSGKTHEVISAYYILKAIKTPRGWQAERSEAMTPPMVKGSKIYHGYDRSFVKVRKLSNDDIKTYLSLTDYTRYTGGYAAIASPQNFITKIDGSLSNVIGLPLEKVIPILQEEKII